MDSIAETFTLRGDATLPPHVASPAWTVLSFRCEEGINEFYRVDIVAALSFDGNNDPKKDADIVLAVLNSSAALFVNGGTDNRVFPGVVTECEVLGGFPHSGRTVRFFRLELRPRMWVATQTRRSRTFVGKTVSEIIKDVLKEHSSAASQNAGAATSGGYDITNLKLDEDDTILNASREFVFQHDETDADFFLRWLERQGWFFYYQFPLSKEDAGLPVETLIVANRIPSVTAWNGSVPMTVDKGGARGIYSLRGKATMIPGQIQVRDYNPNKPDVKLTAAYPKEAEKKALPPLVLADEFFAMNNEGEALAKKRYDSFLCRRTVFLGESNLPGVRSGYVFDCADSRYMFLSARHEGAVPNEHWLGFAPPPGTPAAGYRNEFVCIAAGTTFVPQRRLPWPKIRGVLTGWILERMNGRPGDPWRDSESDNKKIDRYRVFLEVDPDAPSDVKGHSVFMRWQTPSSGKDRGFSAVMHPGTEVQVSFQDGNPDRPFISGTVANANSPVLAWGADEKLFSMTTPRGKEITITEDRGVDAILIASASNPSISVSNNSIESLASYKTDNINLTAQTNAMEMVDFAQLCHLTSTDASFGAANVFRTIGQLANNGMAAFTSFSEKTPQQLPLGIPPDDPASAGATTTFGKSGLLPLILNTIFLGLECRKKLKNTRGRVTITANPEATSIMQTVAPDSAKDKALFAAQMLAVLIDHTSQWYSRFGKPINNDSKNKSISVPDGLAIGNLLASEVSMALLVIKLIQSAHRNRGDNSGIVMDATGGMAGRPPQYRNLDISMRADGNIIAEADKSVYLSSMTEDEEKNAILYLSSNKTADGKGRVSGDDSFAILSAFDTVSIGTWAPDSAIHLGTPGTAVEMHGNDLTISATERTDISGEQAVSVASTHNLTLSGEHTSLQGAKSLAIHYGSDGNLVMGSSKPGQPSIAFRKDNVSTADKVLAENAKLIEEQGKLAAAQKELGEAEQKLQQSIQWLSYLDIEVNLFGGDLETKRELRARRKNAEVAVLKAETTVKSKSAAVDQAKAAVAAQADARKAAIAAVGKDVLLLANGPGGREKITIAQTDVAIESSSTVEIKAGGKRATFNASGLNLHGVIKVNGNMVAIG